MTIPVPRRSEDPREVVTEHAFRVAPDLLGRSLAGPWRRGAALLVDGIAVLFLANAPSLFLGVALAVVLVRASIKPAEGGMIRRSARAATRGVTAVVTVAVVVSAWGVIADWREGGEDEAGSAVEIGGVELSGVEGLAAAAELVAVTTTEDEAEARDRLRSVVARLRAAGVGDDEILTLVRELPLSAADRPWVGAAVDSTVAELERGLRSAARSDTLRAAAGDSLLAAYARAAAAGEDAEAEELREALPAVLASDTIERLEAALARSERRDELLEQALAVEEERRGILDTLGAIADDLGLGLGWSGLYFTAFIVLWRGQTPGKRLLRIRVVRLDGAPLGWWNAFERFAGYAAGLATGLLGLLQIFWDRNRQAIEDKIAGTVVIRD